MPLPMCPSPMNPIFMTLPQFGIAPPEQVRRRAGSGGFGNLEEHPLWGSSGERRMLISGVPSDASPLVIISAVGMDEWLVDHVLGDEPDLGLIGSDHAADQQVVGSVVAVLGCLPGHRARFLQNDLVRVQ